MTGAEDSTSATQAAEAAEGAPSRPVPRPARTPFVGRQRELGWLRQGLEEARQGSGGLLLVSGEPGIGKTRLLAELAAQARADGWQVLEGGAYAAEGLPPYLPFVEALRHAIPTSSPDELQAQLGLAPAAIAPLFPNVSARLPEPGVSRPLSPELDRYRLFEGICGFLLTMGRSAPSGLLLVLEDLHWADPPTLRLLRHLARQVASARVLVVGTYRASEVSRAHPLAELLADLSRAGRAEPLVLAPLSQADAATLVEALSGAPAALAVVQAIYRRSEGNPFFLGQLVRHLQGDRRDLADSRTAAEELAIPPGVQHVIGTRLARLSADANRVLEAGAVLGDGFAADLLAGTSGIEGPALLDALDEALHAGMLREEGDSYRFTHALIRETLLAELSRARQQQFHLRAIAAIERLRARSLDAHLAALVRHYRLAGPAANPEQAIQYALRAGQAARALLAWEDAARHWQTALAWLDEHRGNLEERAHLLEDLGQLMVETGSDPAQGIAYLEQSLAVYEVLGEAERAAVVHAHLGRARSTFPATRDIPGALAHFRAAEAVLARRPESSSLVDLYVGLGVAARWAVQTTDALEASRRACELADHLGDEASQTNALLLRGVALVDSGRLAEGLGLMERAWEAADQSQNVFFAFEAVWYRNLRTWLGDPRDAQAWYRRELARPRLSQAPHHRRILLGLLAWSHTLSGELDEARRILHEMGPGSDWFTAWPTAQLAFRSGLWEQAEALWLREQDRARETGDRLIEWVTTYWLGRLAQARGDAERAEVLLRQALDIAAGQLAYAEVWNRTSLALASAELDRRGAAEQQVTHCRAILAAGEDWRGLVGRVALAEAAVAAIGEGAAGARDRFAQAIATFHNYSLPWDEADALCRWGHALVAAGERKHAIGKFEAALAIYVEHGAGERWLVPIARALDDLNGRAPRATYPDGLSQREIEVLRLLASGSTNKEIATALFLSPRTVERHIANVYTKTRAHRRVDAAAYALRHGLLPTHTGSTPGSG